MHSLLIAPLSFESDTFLRAPFAHLLLAPDMASTGVVVRLLLLSVVHLNRIRFRVKREEWTRGFCLGHLLHFVRGLLEVLERAEFIGEKKR